MSEAPRQSDAWRASSEQFVVAATLGGYFFGLIASVVAGLQELSEHRYSFAGIWTFATLVIVIATIQLIPERKLAPLPETIFFQPLTRPGKLREPWDMSVAANKCGTALLRLLDTSRLPIIFVVGESGSGKSTLLETGLGNFPKDSKRREEDYQRLEGKVLPGIARIASYATDVSRPQLTIGGVTLPLRGVIILDQFEQFLAELRIGALDVTASGRMEAAIRDAARNGCAVLIALRPEWLFDLSSLGDLAPHLQELVRIEGPELSDGGIALRDITERLSLVVEDAPTILGHLNVRGKLNPIEVQIVGAECERHMGLAGKVSTEMFVHNLGGVDGAITLYFDDMIKRADNPRIANKVLCAFSVHTRFRRPMSRSTIIEGIFEDPAKVAAAVDYLVAEGLLRESDKQVYELAHDYLAEFFNRASGSRLEATDRDNILYHFELGKADPNYSVVEPPTEATPKGDIRARHDYFAWYATIPLLLLMVIRLAGIAPWYSGRVEIPHLAYYHIVDPYYVPIFAAHLSWTLYIFLLYDRVLSRIAEGKTARLRSRLVVVIMALCVLVAMYLPGAWLLSIGIGGAVAGMKIFFVGRRHDLNPVASERLRAIGSATMGNLLFVCVFGAVLLVWTLDYVRNQDDLNHWLIFSLLAGLANIYACANLSARHVGRGSAARIIGLMARKEAGVVTRASV